MRIQGLLLLLPGQRLFILKAGTLFILSAQEGVKGSPLPLKEVRTSLLETVVHTLFGKLARGESLVAHGSVRNAAAAGRIVGGRIDRPANARTKPGIMGIVDAVEQDQDVVNVR